MHPKDIVIRMLVSCIIASTTKANTPGAPCPETDYCDSNNTRLECRRQMCLCPSGNRFDYNENKCKLLVGSSCLDIAPNYWTPHSTCNVNNRIECKLIFVETNLHKCAKLHDDSTCGFDECDEDAYLECLGGKCSCNANSVFDQDRNRCTLRADENCLPGPPRIDEELQQCSNFSSCAAGTKMCLCDVGLAKNNDGLCRATHDSPCDSAKPCDENQHLICNATAVCGCRQDAIYDRAVRDCRVQANKQCDKTGDDKCVPNADCEKDGNGREYCICNDGFISTQLGQCVMEFGGPCNESTDCNESGYQMCKNNVCVCKDKYATYDTVTKSCYIPAEGHCTKDDTPCIVNSVCIITTGNVGTCYCQHNTLPVNRRCVIPHGGLCDPENSLCDDFTFLACNASTFTCECAKEDAYFDGTTCKLKANAACVEVPGSQQCTYLAECVAGTCQCITYPGETSLIGNQLGKCVRSYNTPCGREEIGDCDRDFGYQTCQADHCRCGCLEIDNMGYNATDGRCCLEG